MLRCLVQIKQMPVRDIIVASYRDTSVQVVHETEKECITVSLKTVDCQRWVVDVKGAMFEDVDWMLFEGFSIPSLNGVDRVLGPGLLDPNLAAQVKT